MNKKKQISIFVLTYHGSLRERNIKKILNDLNLSYKCIYGLNAKISKHKKKLLKLIYPLKAKIFFGKKIDTYDAACVFGHLQIYKHIVKKHIKSAIILEDDFVPTKKLKQWTLGNNKNFQKFEFIQFYSNSGLVYKKPIKRNKDFNIYKAYTHLPLTSCYQINIRACKFFIDYYKYGIFQSVDFPGDYYHSEIKQYYVHPSVGKLAENHLTTSTNKKIWNLVSYLDQIKKIIPFYYFFNSVISILHIPYLFYFRKIYSYSYYKKYFLNFKIEVFKNYFIRRYILINKLTD